jgi:hypothetical protein
VLVEVGPISLGPIFAVAKWVGLVVLKMKVVSDPLHTSDGFHIFVPNPLRLKQPSTSRILVKKSFPRSGLDSMWAPHISECISFISS